MTTIQIGDIVKASYNSGVYIGKVLEDRKNSWLVEVLAIDKHPTQGDLHNLGHIDKGPFHERKALSFREKMNARKRKTSLYQAAIPDYNDSLHKSIKQLRQELQSENTDYNRAALKKLTDLETHFYYKHKK